MNILHIISGDLWAGAEVQAHTLIHAFAKLNSFNMHIITFNEGILTVKLRGEGIPVTVLDEKKQSMISLTSGCFQVMRIFQPDIVHTHGFKENFIGGIAARLSGNRAVIRTHHGKGMIGAALRYNMIECFNARVLTDELIAVSYELKDFLKGFGLPVGKITVIHNGIEMCNSVNVMKVNALRLELGIPDNAKIIGTVGRLVPIKDHKTLLSGAKLILESEPHTRFMIVGDGPLMGELEQQAHELGISPHVCFTGFREDVCDLLDIFDVFCLTSIHEGTPMALLEAMSLGKPIVATRVGGVSEIIDDNGSGLLIDSGNARSFADACIKILRDRNLSASLSEQAVSAVKGRFLLDVTVRLTQDIYWRIAQS